jgi:hypothetical protein
MQVDRLRLNQNKNYLTLRFAFFSLQPKHLQPEVTSYPEVAP